MNKDIFEIFSPPGSHTILHRVSKNCIFVFVRTLS